MACPISIRSGRRMRAARTGKIDRRPITFSRPSDTSWERRAGFLRFPGLATPVYHRHSLRFSPPINIHDGESAQVFAIALPELQVPPSQHDRPGFVFTGVNQISSGSVMVSLKSGTFQLQSAFVILIRSPLPVTIRCDTITESPGFNEAGAFLLRKSAPSAIRFQPDFPGAFARPLS